MYQKRLHQFSLFVTVCTFILIFLGGLVTSTGSGLSVPDWPTTYGENMFSFPINKWIGGIKYEHGHRLFASFVGFITVILTIWISIKEKRKWLKILSWIVLGAVIVQGILGGITVLFLLPTPVSVAHGMLAQFFFCLVASISLFTSQWWTENSLGIVQGENNHLLLLSLVTFVVIFIQLALGALMRHTHSGLAVPDFPLAYNQIFPTFSPESITKYNEVLVNDGIRHPADLPISSYQILIHLFHRYWAYIVAISVLLLGTLMLRSTSIPILFRRNGTLLIIIVVLQFLLGILTVLTKKIIIVTTLHVAIGAVLLIFTVISGLQLVRISKIDLFHPSY